MLHQVEHPRSRRLGAFHLLNFELLRPRNHRPPHELIEQHNQQNHRGNAPEDRNRVARAGRSLQIGAQSGQTKIALSQHEHFTHHKREPSPRHRHHRVPHQTDGRRRQLHLRKALPPAKTVDRCGFPHLVRNALQRAVKAESHVPYLAGEDEKDGPHLHAELPAGKKRHHGQHHGGKKAEHRDGLQHVQQRNHKAFGARVIGRHIAVHQRETQAQAVSDGDAQQRIPRIGRQRPHAARNLDRWREGAKPGAAHARHPIKDRNPRGEHDDIGQARNFDARQLRPQAIRRESSQGNPFFHATVDPLSLSSWASVAARRRISNPRSGLRRGC